MLFDWRGGRGGGGEGDPGSDAYLRTIEAGLRKLQALQLYHMFR